MDKLIGIIKGLRKWSIMMIIIIIGVIFLVNGLLSGLEFVALVKGVGVAFMASNAVERTIEGISKKKTKKKTNKKLPKEDMSED